MRDSERLFPDAQETQSTNPPARQPAGDVVKHVHIQAEGSNGQAHGLDRKCRYAASHYIFQDIVGCNHQVVRLLRGGAAEERVK
jgi:hypothetical protein